MAEPDAGEGRDSPEAQLFSEELIQAVAAVSTHQDFIQKSQSRLGGRPGDRDFL